MDARPDVLTGAEEDRIVFRAAIIGIAFGLPIGMIFGALLVALGMWQAGQPLTAGAVLGAGAYGGFMAGLFFGAVSGVAARIRVLHEDDAGTEDQERTVATEHVEAA